MGNIIGGLTVILVTAIIIGVIFYLVHVRGKKGEELIMELAQKQGWRYEKVSERLKAGYRIYGPRWTLEGLRISSESSSDTGSSNIRDYTLLRTPEVTFSPGILMIGPKQPEINLGGITDVIKQTMLKLMVGDEAEGAEGILESLIGRMALHERYMVWTNREEAARELLTPEVENALIRYPGKIPPVVKLNAKGLEVKLISIRLRNPAEIEGLVAIGEAFLL
jgi:hypothetical protein